MSRLRTVAATDTGYLRATNQDRAIATSDLAAVADGMGGHLGGEVAARIAIEQLFAAFRRDRTTDGLIVAVREANAAVYRRSRADRNLRGMGTTLTAAAVVGSGPGDDLRLALVNVGDSRAYILDRPGQRIHKLTEDHSVVEEMVRSGELTEDEAAVHPHKHILTRALGIEPQIEADCWELDLEPASRLLICSDGLTNELSDQEIARVLLDKPDAGDVASELVRQALARGGIDNVTVVVLDVVPGDAPAPSEDIVVIPVSAPGTSSSVSSEETAAITQAIAFKPEAGDAPGGARSGSSRRPVLLVRPPKGRRAHEDRVVTFRVAVFTVVFAVVLASVAGTVLWFDKASFYVGLDQGYVTIFQGRPGGLLWLKPSVVERTTVKPSDLLPSEVVYLRQGVEESSYQAARDTVHTLSLEHKLITSGDSVTTTTSAPTHNAKTTAAVGGRSSATGASDWSAQ